MGFIPEIIYEILWNHPLFTLVKYDHWPRCNMGLLGCVNNGFLENPLFPVDMVILDPRFETWNVIP